VTKYRGHTAIAMLIAAVWGSPRSDGNGRRDSR